MARIDGTSSVAVPSSAGGGSSTNTAAVNAAQTQLTGAQQRLSTARDGIGTLESAATALRGDITGAQGRVDTAQSEFQALQTQLTGANTAVTTAQQGVTTAQADFDTASQTLTTAQGDLETAQSAQQTAQSELEAAAEALQAAQDRHDTSTEAVEAAQERFDAAQEAIETAQARVDDAQTRVTDAQTRVTDAQTAVTDAQTRVTDAETAVADAETRVADAQTAVADAETRVSDAETAVDTAQSDLDAANDAVTTARDNLTTANDELTAANDAVTAAQGDVEAADARVSAAEATLTAATGRVTSAQNRVNSAQGAVSSAQNEVNAAQAELNRARAAKPPDSARIARAQSRLNSARSRLSSAQSELNNAREALRQAQEAERQARQALETARREAEEARRRLAEAQERQRQAEEAKRQAEEALRQAEEAQRQAQQALEAAQAELEAAQEALATAQEQLAEAQEALAEAQEELAEAQEALADAQAELEEAQTELEEAQTELEEAQTELTDAQAELEEAQTELTDAQAEQETAQQELEAAQEAEEQAQTALEEADQAVDDAQDAVDEAQDAVDEAQEALDAAQEELETAQAEQEELQAQVDEAQEALDSAREELDALQAQLDDKEAQLADAQSRIDAAQAEVDAAEAALEQARTAARNDDDSDDRANIAGDANNDGILSDAERNALIESGNFDDLPQAERDRLLAQQAELEAAEQAARERYSDVDGTVTNSTDATDQVRLNSELRDQAEQEIIDERRRYYEQNPYYVDQATGQVMVASVDDDGNLVLSRSDSTPPQGGNPQLDTERTTTIETDRDRTDVAVTRNVPRNDQEPRQTRTETVHTNAEGERTGSQISLEQERDNANGSSERSYTEESYDADNVATQRVEEQSRTEANGDTTSDRVTTSFREDGTTPRSTFAEHHQTIGDTESSRETRTFFHEDGTTPTRQVVETAGTDQPDTRAETLYHDDGEPDSTHITRDGELPEGTPASEYVVWGAGGQVDARYHGRDGRSREDFQDYIDRSEAAGNFVERAALRATTGIRKVDADYLHGSEDPIEYTRQDDNRFDGRELGANLVEPLEASRDVPSVFDVPAQLRARANAGAIDSRFANDPAAVAELDREQAAYEQELAGATTDAQRERIMREYFETHAYWIDRGGEGDDPVVLAATWSDGAPQSDMFGASRAADPHAVAARTGIEGVNDQGQPATIDVVQRFYTDGSQDDVVRTDYEGPAGASRTVVTGEHTSANGNVVEVDRHAETLVPRVEQGLDPLAVTEISRERFADRTGPNGQPVAVGEQYHAVATSDDTITSLEEQRDYYTTDGVIYDTKIESTQMSRNFDEELTDDFLAANAAQIERAQNDDLDINDDGTSITTPPVGAFYAHSETDIDYDSDGVAIFQEVEDETITVAESDIDDGGEHSGSNNGNGVKVTSTSTTRTTGERDGTAPIFDEDGARIVDEDVTTTISTSEFDPDAGRAGGNNGDGFQFRETTELTVGVTNRPDGSRTNEWATPLTINTLMEGHDDDWVFTEQFLRTDGTGQLVNEDGEPLGEGDEPVKLGEGDEAYNAAGERITLERDGRKHEDLDFSDKFESFMEGWGGKIVGAAGVVVGVALIATGVGSPLGVALAAGGVALASTQFAYTALNYSQGEASGFDLALAGAGVAFSAIPAITGVRQLSNAGRLANSARAGAGAIDDVARAGAGAATNGTRTAGQQALRVVHGTETGLDAYDGYDAARAALRGDFYGAALMLGAIGGGRAVNARVHGGGRPGGVDAGDGAPGSARTPDTPTTPDVPDLPDAGSLPGIGGDRPGTPATSTGAPTLRTPDVAPAAGGTQPLPGSRTGFPAANLDVPTTAVDGVRGDGVDAAPAGTTDASRAGAHVQPSADSGPRTAAPTTTPDAVFRPAADALPTPDAPSSIEGITAYGRRADNGSYPPRAIGPNQPTVVYRTGADGQIDGVAYYDANGKPVTRFDMGADGTWTRVDAPEMTYPSGRTNRQWDDATARPAESHEVPSNTLSNDSVLADAAARSAAVREQAGPVLQDADAMQRGVEHSLDRHEPSRIAEFQRQLAEDPNALGENRSRLGDADVSTFRDDLTHAELDAIIRNGLDDGVWIRQGDGSHAVIIDTGDVPIGLARDGRATSSLTVIVDPGGNVRTAFPAHAADSARVAYSTNPELFRSIDPAAARPAVDTDAQDTVSPTYGRDTLRSDRAPLEPPIARDREVRGGLAIRDGRTAPALDALFTGRLGSADGFGGIGRGIGPDGRVIVDTPAMRRNTSLDNVIASNPDVVARLGGADVVRANPALLDGQTINVRRSSGQVEPGWTVDGINGDGSLNMAQYQRTSMDLGEYLVRRQQADPSFDGRAALRDVIDADPSILQDRPLRLRRSETSIAEGRAAHNIDDGWQVAGSSRAPDGSLQLRLVKNYRFEDLPPASQAKAAERGYGPGSIVPQQRSGISLDEVLDYNRARLEGDHGQVPRIDVRVGTPDGQRLGIDRDLAAHPSAARADQAVVHTQAALDYLYSRYGYVPTGGDIRLVIDADGAHRNASMQSQGNILRIGTHENGGGAFDPSVIMHELGHKMVDDFTAGHYGATQAGAIHEGFADVAAAGWTHDAIVGRVFDQQGRQGIRDIRSGERLLGTRAEWEAASQTRDGAGAHRGSGVVTGVASRIAGDGTNGGLGWGEVGDLYNDALRSGAMRQQMDFDSFSDALRIAAADRYGVASPQYRRVVDSLRTGGLEARPQPGASVSRISSRGEILHGLRFDGYAGPGRAIVTGPDGQSLVVSADGILTGGGRTVSTDAAGGVVPITASPSRAGRQGAALHADDASTPDPAAAAGQAPNLPDRDLPAPHVRRIRGTDGNPAVVYGRLPDGRLILGDGTGSRYAASPLSVFATNMDSFSHEALRQGSTATVRRPDGSWDDAATINGYNADGTVRVQSGDSELTIDVANLAETNLHRFLPTGVTARIPDGSGGLSEGWTPYGMRGNEVHVQRVNGDGSVERATVGALAFVEANGDRMMGTLGALPGQPLRWGRGGEHAIADSSIVEGRDFTRVSAGELSQASGYLFRGGIQLQHGDVLIRIETDPGAPTLDVRRQVETVMAGIDALPPEMRRNITEVNVLEGRNPADAHWAQVTGAGDFRSGATAGANNVNVFYGTRGDFGLLFAHEATHTFGRNGGPFYPDHWLQQMTLDAAHLASMPHVAHIRPLIPGMRLDLPTVSGYAQLQFDAAPDATGRRNVKEDWAETGSYVVRGEQNGGVVAERRRWWGGVKRYTMADLFPNRTRTFNDYRSFAQQQLNGGPQPGQPVVQPPSAPAPTSSSTGGAGAAFPMRFDAHAHGAMSLERSMPDDDDDEYEVDAR